MDGFDLTALGRALRDAIRDHSELEKLVTSKDFKHFLTRSPDRSFSESVQRELEYAGFAIVKKGPMGNHHHLSCRSIFVRMKNRTIKPWLDGAWVAQDGATWGAGATPNSAAEALHSARGKPSGWYLHIDLVYRAVRWPWDDKNATHVLVLDENELAISARGRIVRE
jgi:hypothetical protein